jgi:hypothetical protein
LTGDEGQADDDGAARCATCAHRPARPGSPYCSGFCRALAVLRRLRVLARPGYAA